MVSAVSVGCTEEGRTLQGKQKDRHPSWLVVSIGKKCCVPHVCWAGERQLLTSVIPLLLSVASLSCSVSSLARVPAPQTTW